MRKLSLTLFSVAVATSAVVACGSDSASTSDAKAIDAKSIDAKVFLDAAGSGSGSGSANYDFTCFGGTPATTAADPITITGVVDELSLSGLNAKADVPVALFKTGNATALATTTSAATTGDFASGNLVTGGVPLDAFVRASFAAYRTTYLYPPNPAKASLANVPVPIISNSTFGTLQQFGQATQNDTNNGAFLLILSDCAQNPINGASVTVQQNNANVGTVFDLGSFAAQAAGLFFVFNVPDGNTTVTAKYGTMTFPVRILPAHKGVDGVGSITATEVLPGPL